MKKLLVVLLILTLIVGAGYFFITDRVEKEAVTQIETRLSQSFGEDVEVAEIDISPARGRAVIRDFKAPAKQGKPFKEQLSFGELEMDIDYFNRKIQTLRLSNPVINVEMLGNTGNRRFSPDGQGQRVEIDQVLIQNAMLGLYNPNTNNLQQYKIDNVRLNNLNGTAEQIADQIMQAIAAQIPDQRASEALLREGRRNLPGLNQEFEQAWQELGG